MTGKSWLGMIVTITGIAIVVLKREEFPKIADGRRKFRFNYPIWGSSWVWWRFGQVWASS